MNEHHSHPKTARPIALLVLLVVCHLSAGTALACSCIPVAGSTPAEIARELSKTASTVFVGTVESIVPPLAPSDEPDVSDHVYTFKVSKVFKGPAKSTYTVRAQANDEQCGILFSKGTEYLIFASGNPSADVQGTGLCSGSAPVDSAREIVSALGAL